MEHTKPSYYITTPIYYVNAKPHLGTAYCTVLADVQARFRRSCGYDVKFLTGMDEHGEKVAEAAEKNGFESPQAWCDSMEPAFTDLWRELEISNDDFIRTTQPRHTAGVQKFLKELLDRGYIYTDAYDGWYCRPDETYFTETQVRHHEEERVAAGEAPADPEHPLCPDCDRPLERIQEESWFFKLSAFEQPLLDFYEAHPDFIQPETRRNEVISFVKGGLKDLSISRSTFDWGVPFPFDERHVAYVWVDALINYLSAVGYGAEGEEAAQTLAFRWPAQVHVVGKDIIRFHCVIWPALLMAAGLPLPEKVFVHGFLTVRNEETGKIEKMSKSRGNVIAPQEVVDLLGVDAYRYYFMTDVVHGADSPISWGRMRQVYNADLANSWGNLVSRTLNMSAKYFDGCAPVRPADFERATALHDACAGVFERYAARMEAMDFGGAVSEVLGIVSAANHYIEDKAPWALAKDPAQSDELAHVIWSLLEVIRIATELYDPFMPSISAEVRRRLSLDTAPTADLAAACAWGGLEGGAPVEKGQPLFPRLTDE
ncbi:methionine--tRNA ligase [Enorma phocaeensis]|uniref:methionine--tRNA ligase n=1 Tax=Enorma phocaeensis TaxID=1871019 RepID=UPI000C84BB13|nr:methionine--tRNA ligase [Enorma phocaeensis]